MEPLFKGTGVIGYRNYIDSKFGMGFFDQKMKEIDPKWNSQVIPSSWYNAQNMVKAICNIYDPVNDKRKILEMGEILLENDLNGVYKFFMKLGGPQKVLAFIPQLATAYTNYIKVIILENKVGYIKAENVVPNEMAEYTALSTESALKGTIKACGFQSTFTLLSNEQTLNGNGTTRSLIYECRY